VNCRRGARNRRGPVGASAFGPTTLDD